MTVEVVRSSAGFGYIPVNLTKSLREEAAEVFTPEGVEQWMTQPNGLLSGDIPSDLARTKLGYLRARAVLDGLKDGVFF